MQAYATKGIKDIIAEFPEVGKILEEYGIGCGPCTVGICQLKDILEIHKMSREVEQELMLRLEAEIYPERNIGVPPHTVVREPSASEKISYSEPFQILVDEHKLIKRWLALIPGIAQNLSLRTTKDRRVIEDGIDLIRSYADRLHHGKEEDILFTYFDDREDIFQVIYEDHRRARELVQQMISALEEDKSKEVSSGLLMYAALLQEHIHKEDEVLFPWLDHKLTDEEKEELMASFIQADINLAVETGKYRLFIEKLERQARVEKT